MRTIKFDAIYKPTGLHVEVVELNFNDNTITYRDENGDCDWCHFSLDGKYGDVILRQFSGLHDKNGNEIYEGDILEVKQNYHFKIIWHEESWGYEVIKNEAVPVCGYIQGHVSRGGLKHYNNTSEIIGNIYENPDLLERTS